MVGGAADIGGFDIAVVAADGQSASGIGDPDAAEAVGDIHRPGDVARHDRAVAVQYGDIAIVAADLDVAEAVLDAVAAASSR